MKLCIVGTGYVGLVSAACFAEMGNTVTCVDVNPAVVEKLNAGSVHIFEPGLEPMVQRSRADGRLSFTTSLEQGIADADCAFICVGTPPQPDGSCDLSYVRQVAAEIGRHMQKELVVVDKSTVPVGTADMVRGIIEKELASRGLDLRVDVVSNPEFLKEGDAISDFMKPDRVVLGTDSERAASIMRELYAPFARTREKLIVMRVRSAEMTKYAANCMLATKISFINEIATICEKVGADVRTAESAGVEPMLLNAVEAVNARQKKHMAERIQDYFAPQGGVKGKTLALWGLAFKANTDDMREAASISIVNALTAAGMKIRAFDPVAADNARRIFKDNALVEILDDQYGVCRDAQALLVVTEWNQFRNPDFDRVKSLLTAPLLFDGRNLYSPSAMAERGFAYFCIGRPTAAV